MFPKGIRYSITGLVCVVCGLVLVLAGGVGYPSEQPDLADTLFWGLLLVGILFIFLGSSMIVKGKGLMAQEQSVSSVRPTPQQEAFAQMRQELQRGYVLGPGEQHVIQLPYAMPPTYAQSTLHPVYVISPPSTAIPCNYSPTVPGYTTIPSMDSSAVPPPPPYDSVPKPPETTERRHSEV